MKKVIVLLIFIAAISFVNAQQPAATGAVKQATPVMKVDATNPVPAANVPVVKNTESAKACCAGKTAAECSHGKKECSKGEAKATCCQKTATGQTCNHAASEKSSKTKAE